MNNFNLYKDGVLIESGQNDWFIPRYIHAHHSYSVSHACKYEGYTITNETGEDITKQYILK